MSAISQKGTEFLLRSRIADAEAGDVDALFDLGVAFSTGRGGLSDDLAWGSRVGQFGRPGRGRGMGGGAGQTASAVSGRSTASFSVRSTTAARSP